MTTLASYYTLAAAAVPPYRRWVTGAGYSLGERVAWGESIPAARARILATSQYADALAATGLTGAFNAVSTITGPDIDVFADSINGTDAANGTSLATAVQTLGRAAAVITAGQTLGLARGSRFKETLTIPGSGSSVVAYGSGSPPVIDGGEPVTGWSAYSGGAPYEYAKDDFAGTAGADLTTSTMEIGGPWVKQSTFSGTNTMVLTAAGTVRRGTTGLVVYYATATPPSADYAVEADFLVKSLLTTDPSRLAARTDTSAQTQYTLAVDPSAGGQLAFSKFVTGAGTSLLNVPFTWVAGQTYKLRLEVEGDTLRGYVDGALLGTVTDTAIFSAGKAGLRLGGGSAPAPSDTTGIHVDNFRVMPIGAGGTPTNTYQATLAAESKLVELRGRYSVNGTSPDTLADGQFYWVAGKLYVRSDAGQPSDTDVIGGVRANCISGGTLSNVTIKGVACEHANDRTIVFTGGTGTVIDGCIIQRSSGGTGNNGTVAFQAHSGWTVRNTTIRDCGSDGIYAVTSTGMTVADNKIGPVYGPNADCVQVDSADGATVGSSIARNQFTMTGSLSPKGCVILFGDSHVLEDNYFEGGNNFGVSCPGSHFVIRRNVFYRTGPGGAVRIMDNPPGIALDDHLVHTNVMIDCPVGILVSSGGTNKNRTGQRYISNTIANVAVAVLAGRGQIWADQPVSGELKDNILWNESGTGAALVFSTVVAGQAWASDFNLVGPERPGVVSYGGTSYDTLAAYQQARGQDRGSISQNPMFMNPGDTSAAGYRLQPGSPAASEGAPVAGIQDQPRIGAL